MEGKGKERKIQSTFSRQIKAIRSLFFYYLVGYLW
jgi:hypothetical protein